MECIIFLRHVTQLAPALASHTSNNAVTKTITIFMSRQLKWDPTLFLVIWNHWCQCQCHMKPMASSMTQLHSLDQNVQNEIWHDLFYHVMPLGPGLAPTDENSVINGMSAFTRSRWSKWGATLLLCHVMPLTSALHNTSGFVNGKWHWSQHQ